MTRKRTKNERGISKVEAPAGRELTRVLDLLAGRTVTVKARQRQRLALGIDCTETLYFIKSGALIVNSDGENNRRSILTILYNGDVFRTSSVPPTTLLVLTALVPSVLVRCPWSVFEEVAAKDFSLARFYMRQSVRQVLTGNKNAIQRRVSVVAPAAQPRKYLAGGIVSQPEVKHYLT